MEMMIPAVKSTPARVSKTTSEMAMMLLGGGGCVRSQWRRTARGTYDVLNTLALASVRAAWCLSTRLVAYAR